jgi:hypothetical protein
MSNPTKTDEASAMLFEKILIGGDLSGLSASQRTDYVLRVCTSLGLNPLTKPFDYMNLSGKTVLYAKRDCTDQLRSIHKISINITDRTFINDICVVTAKALNPLGRQDESTGAVSIKNLTGESLANAMMKAETKAKRRVTLSICGLGVLDESELDTVPHTPANPPAEPKDAKPAPVFAAPPEQSRVDTIIDGELTSAGDYVLLFGKFKGSAVKSIPIEDLESYVRYIESESVKSGKEIKGNVQDFIFAAKAFMEEMDRIPF